jgi:hypothetical protein
MKKVQSADGTTIAFDQWGQGPALMPPGQCAPSFLSILSVNVHVSEKGISRWK